MGMQIGCLHVRRSILIQASPERVWREFESFERIAAWLDRGHRLHAFEPRLSGKADFSIEMDGKRVHYGGSILVFEPQREVTFESQWEPPQSWVVPTFWTFRLTPVYDATMVELFHHGFERLGAEAADNLQGYEEGWDVQHLKTLRSIVEP
jgi:uncharacterized protein YndB with AHSA1/START domain